MTKQELEKKIKKYEDLQRKDKDYLEKIQQEYNNVIARISQRTGAIAVLNDLIINYKTMPEEEDKIPEEEQIEDTSDTGDSETPIEPVNESA